MARTNILTKATAMAGLIALNATLCTGSSHHPDVAAMDYASLQTAHFFQGYYTAKSSDNAAGWLSYFNVNHTGYYDSTLGFAITNYTTWAAEVEALTSQWKKTAPNDKSYFLRILGDTTAGAIVYMVDTPGLFGAEIRSLSSFDFLDGKIRRQIDNWDGRGNVVASNYSVPDNQYPHDFGLAGLPKSAAGEMQATVTQLNNALSANDAAAASALFSDDAVFEDLTLRVRVEGRIAIRSYLLRALKSLPYGSGAAVTHVLGNAQGGGYEWQPNAKTTSVRYGISALELCSTGNITRFTAVWDGSRLNQTAIRALAALSPTP